MKVGQNIKLLRLVYDISVKEMSSYLMMSEHNYHKIERNAIGIKFEKATKIAGLFQITLDDLVNKNGIAIVAEIHQKGEIFLMQNKIRIKLNLSPPIKPTL